MMKRVLIALVALLAFNHAAMADHLPKENWSAMNPTVKIVSYKWNFNGQVQAYGSGSGTVVSASGLLLTNNHVIFDETEQIPLDAFEVCVTFEVEKEPLCNYTATLVAHDKDLDIAILDIDEKDVLGNALPPLNHLSYQGGEAPQEKQVVDVAGYPASGGSTITLTRGQISGFDRFNNYKYFKTDTDFDHGSSGGTALDAEGRFIGIPTYIRTYAENVGYFLDLREALPWISKHIDKNPSPNAPASAELRRQMARFFKANDTLTYETDRYPFLKLSLPEDWHFFQLEDDRIYAAQNYVNDAVGLMIHFENHAFPIDAAYLKKLDEAFIEARDRFPDFKKEASTFAGLSAERVTYTSYNQKNTIYYIPYGYSLMSVSYGIKLDKEAEQLKTLKPVLHSIELVGEAIKNPKLPAVYTHDFPPFSMKAFDGWRLQPSTTLDNTDLLVRGFQSKNNEGQFSAYYFFVPQDERQLSDQERLDEMTESIGRQDAKVVTKKDDVVLDGLPGYLYIFEYEGGNYQEIRKQLVLELQHGDHAFSLEYDDLSENFDKNLPTIQKMLNSFDYTGDPLEHNGEYNFGTLGERFSDIRYHRFASAISELADKGIVKGYSDGQFRPEAPILKAEALKMILASKNQREKDRGLGKEVRFEDYGTPDPWFKPYETYAREKNFFDQKAPFAPTQSITLAEALKWLMAAYEIPVWQGTANPWYKPYIDKGYELGLLPRGFENPTQKLTRAELSYLVNTVYNQAK